MQEFSENGFPLQELSAKIDLETQFNFLPIILSNCEDLKHYFSGLNDGAGLLSYVNIVPQQPEVTRLSRRSFRIFFPLQSC